MHILFINKSKKRTHKPIVLSLITAIRHRIGWFAYETIGITVINPTANATIRIENIDLQPLPAPLCINKSTKKGKPQTFTLLASFNRRPPHHTPSSISLVNYVGIVLVLIGILLMKL